MQRSSRCSSFPKPTAFSGCIAGTHTTSASCQTPGKPLMTSCHSSTQSVVLSWCLPASPIACWTATLSSALSRRKVASRASQGPGEASFNRFTISVYTVIPRDQLRGRLAILASRTDFRTGTLISTNAVAQKGGSAGVLETNLDLQCIAPHLSLWVWTRLPCCSRVCSTRPKVFALYLSVRQQRCLPWWFIGRDASSSAQGSRYWTFKEHTVEWMTH